jgi:hypothetical protein
MGLSISLNRTTGAEGGTAHTQLGILAPNEWALNLRRTLKQASAGLSQRFESLNEAIISQNSQYVQGVDLVNIVEH